MGRKRKEVVEGANGNSEPKIVESKADKFRRLANLRLGKAVKALRMIQRLGNRASYEWTEDQADKVYEILAAEVNKARAAMEPKTTVAAVATEYL